MANSICRWQCPEDWSEWSLWLAAGLHARNRWRLPVLLVGILFAHGRRTVIRVVIVLEDHDWYPFFSTDPQATAVEIIEAFADRATIEQDFHDVKEVWGAGQQQVRNIWTKLAVYHLNLWMHTLVELWSWHRSHGKLCDRSQSPWDDAERRPSHADRRQALRRQIMEHELSTLAAAGRLPRKILQLAHRLMALAT